MGCKKLCETFAQVRNYIYLCNRKPAPVGSVSFGGRGADIFFRRLLTFVSVFGNLVNFACTLKQDVQWMPVAYVYSYILWSVVMHIGAGYVVILGTWAYQSLQRENDDGGLRFLCLYI